MPVPSTKAAKGETASGDSLPLSVPKDGSVGTRPSYWFYATLAVVALSFSATGPVALIVSSAQQGGFSDAEMSSWIFAVFFFNGLATIAFSAVTRQPMVFLWSIPGTVLIAPVAAKYGLPAVIGTHLLCGVFLVAAGATRLINGIEHLVPIPIIMGMICGLFTQFAIGIVDSTLGAPLIGASMLVTFFGLLYCERNALACRIPPILGAIVVGVIVMAWTGVDFPPFALETALASPVLHRPQWNLASVMELAIPMLVTIIFVQNSQGLAVVRQAGHRPSTRSVTSITGIMTLVTAPFCGCPTVLAGPCNAVLVSGGVRQHQYWGAVFVGLISLVIGIFAAFFSSALTSLPSAFVALTAGLAMLGVLEKSFVAAFSSKLPFSAMVAFAVTLSGVSLFNIGAAFWGVFAGTMMASLIERKTG